MISKNVLIWGRFGNYGPDYPRNRVIESVLRTQGHRVSRFVPKMSWCADWEYVLRGGKQPDVIWVPCFRQRDLPAAARYAKRNNIPLVFDPLISAYDKQVNERKKFDADSHRGQSLLAHERALFSKANIVIADTAGHAAYFSKVLNVPKAQTFVIAVGAEEALFTQAPWIKKAEDSPLEVVFFGTFIELQGVDVIAEAITQYQGKPIHWRLIGQGSLLAECQEKLSDTAQLQQQGSQVSFEPWGPLHELPARLASADIILGIFGRGEKTQRVIPNKVYQALAIGKPVITARTEAYPETLRVRDDAGIYWVLAGDSQSLLDAINLAYGDRERLALMAGAARQSYDEHFSNKVIDRQIAEVLQACFGEGV
jgi:glycosyltransferase involved in cell wall biosynthesis